MAKKGYNEEQKGRKKRSAILKNQIWDKCIIPYEFDAQFENVSIPAGTFFLS